jgi:hypothetical protein
MPVAVAPLTVAVMRLCPSTVKVAMRSMRASPMTWLSMPTPSRRNWRCGALGLIDGVGVGASVGLGEAVGSRLAVGDGLEVGARLALGLALGL